MSNKEYSGTEDLYFRGRREMAEGRNGYKDQILEGGWGENQQKTS